MGSCVLSTGSSSNELTIVSCLQAASAANKASDLAETGKEKAAETYETAKEAAGEAAEATREKASGIAGAVRMRETPTSLEKKFLSGYATDVLDARVCSRVGRFWN